MNQPLPKPTETQVVRDAARTVRPHLRVIEGGRGAATTRTGTAVAGRVAGFTLGTALAAVTSFFAVLLWSTPAGDPDYDPDNFEPYDPENDPYLPKPAPVPPVCVQGCAQASSDSDASDEPIESLDPKGRKYGDKQTCDNETLARLQAEKDGLNDELGANPMTPRKANMSNLKMIGKSVPCSVLKRRLEIQERMLTNRWEIQNVCFGGKPDPTHQGAIEQAENMIKNTKRYIEQNCAAGHDMVDK